MAIKKSDYLRALTGSTNTSNGGGSSVSKSNYLKALTSAPQQQVTQQPTQNRGIDPAVMNSLIQNRLPTQPLTGMERVAMPTKSVTLQDVAGAVSSGYDLVKKGAGAIASVPAGIIGAGAVGTAKTAASFIPGINEKLGWQNGRGFEDIKQGYQSGAQMGAQITEGAMYMPEAITRSAYAFGAIPFDNGEALKERVSENIAGYHNIAAPFVGKKLSDPNEVRALLEDPNISNIDRNMLLSVGIIGTILDVLPLIRGGASAVNKQALKAPIIKSTPTGRVITMEMDDFVKTTVANELNKAGFSKKNIVTTPDGIEVIIGDEPIKFTPENIKVSNVPQGTIKASEMKPTAWGRATSDIKQFFRRTDAPSVDFIPANQLPPPPQRGVQPYGQAAPEASVPALPSQRALPTTQVAPALTSGAGQTIIPPQPATTQAEFQMIDPVKSKKEITNTQKLIKAVDDEITNIKKNPTRESAAQLKELKKDKTFLENKLNNLKEGQVTATGPVRVGDFKKALIGEQVISKQPEVATAVAKPTPKIVKQEPQSVKKEIQEVKPKTQEIIKTAPTRAIPEVVNKLETIKRVLPTKQKEIIPDGERIVVKKDEDGTSKFILENVKNGKITGRQTFSTLSEAQSEMQTVSQVQEIKRSVGRPKSEMSVGSKEEYMRSRSEKMNKLKQAESLQKAKDERRKFEMEKARKEAENARLLEAQRQMEERKKFESKSEATWKEMSVEEMKEVGYSDEQIKNVLQKRQESKAAAEANIQQTKPKTKADKLKAELFKLKAEGKNQDYFYKMYQDEFTKITPEDLDATKESTADIILDFITEEAKKDPTFKSKRGLGISEFEQRTRTTPANVDNFKLYEEGYRLAKKYAKKVTEKYVPRNASGVTYNANNFIGVKSFNNISTITHELVHIIDNTLDLTKQFKDPQIINDLHQIYKDYYGGAANADLHLKTVEGFAAFVQAYVETPSEIMSKFPTLIKQILTPGGKHYQPIFSELLSDVEDITSRYQKLDSLNKIGSIIIDDTRNLSAQEKFFNLKDEFVTQVFDYIHNLEKTARYVGADFTDADPSIWLRNSQRVVNVFNNNIMPASKIGVHKGNFLTPDSNFNFVPKYNYNYGTVAKELRELGLDSDYSKYLAARQSYFEFKEFDELNAKLDKTPEELKRQEQLAEITKNNKIPFKVAEDAYLSNKDRFKEFDIKVDNLNKETLRILNHPLVRLMDNETFSALTSRRGYAAMRRIMIDEFADMLSGGSSYKAKGLKISAVSSLKGKKGSDKPILAPFIGDIINHGEILRKATRQITYNKLYDLVMQNKVLQDVFVPLPYDVRFENDPNVMIARDADYNRVVLTIPKEIKGVFDMAFNGDEVSGFVKSLKWVSDKFIVGTTGVAYPFFIPVNVTMDLFNALIQSRNAAVPFISAAREFAKAVSKKDPEALQFFNEYYTLGGHHQTLINLFKDSPEDFYKKINKEIAGIKKYTSFIESATDIVRLPSQISEDANRALEYYLARKAGKSQAVAMEESGRVTVPFHHIGKWGKQAQLLKAIYPYVNVPLQAGHVFYQTIRNKETRGKALLLMAIATTYIVYKQYTVAKKLQDAIDSGDNERIQEALLEMNIYREQSMYDKSNYLYGTGLNRVRATPNITTLGTLINMLTAEAIIGKKYDLIDYLDLAGQWLPNQLDIANPKTMLASVIPQQVGGLFFPLINIKTYPDVKQLVSGGLTYEQTQNQYYDNTNKFAVALGQTQLAKSLKLSPIQISEIIKNYTGRGGLFLSNIPAEITMDVINGGNFGDAILKQIGNAQTLATRPWNYDTDIVGGKSIDNFFKEKKLLDGEYKNNKNNYKVVEKYKYYNLYSDTINDLRSISYSNPEQLTPEIYNSIYELTQTLEKGQFEKSKDIYNKILNNTYNIISNYKRLKKEKEVEKYK